jgi:hypothetical protein
MLVKGNNLWKMIEILVLRVQCVKWASDGQEGHTTFIISVTDKTLRLFRSQVRKSFLPSFCPTFLASPTTHFSSSGIIRNYMYKQYTFKGRSHIPFLKGDVPGMTELEYTDLPGLSAHYRNSQNQLHAEVSQPAKCSNKRPDLPSRGPKYIAEAYRSG